MNWSTRRFLIVYLAALLIPLLSARAEDRTTARAPLPPLPAPPADPSAVKPAIRFDEQSAAQAGDQGHDALHPEQAARDKPGHGTVPRKKNAQAGRREHRTAPAGTEADAAAASPPQQLSPPSREYDPYREPGPEPGPGDIASADREPTSPTIEDLQTDRMGQGTYPPYQRQFGYPWPYGSPQAGGFPPYPAYPPYPPSPPYRVGGNYPDFPPPLYFPYTAPYRYP